jgi:integrase/recombinase XerD
MGRGVALCAELLTGGKTDAEQLAWWQLRGQHTAALRAQLIQHCQAVSTCNLALSAVRGVLRAAARLGHMTHEDCAGALAELEHVRGEVLLSGRALSDDEIRRLYAGCEQDGLRGLRDAALIALLESGGLRRAEAVGLEVQDYHAGVIRVRKGKGRKAREVPLDGSTQRRLEAWLAASASTPAAPLLCSVLAGGRPRLGQPLSVDHVNVLLAQRGEAAGLAPVTPHDLRRTCASELLDSGADVLTVQKILGHADPRTTQRYDRRPERAKVDAVNRREELRLQREKTND